MMESVARRIERRFERRIRLSNSLSNITTASTAFHPSGDPAGLKELLDHFTTRMVEDEATMRACGGKRTGYWIC